jgi:hypothetical protein
MLGSNRSTTTPEVLAMLRNATIGLAVVLGCLGVGSTAQAQFMPGPNYNPYGGPALSPYLNLLRGGDTASNYYLGVVPERFNRSAFGTILGGGGYGAMGLRNLDIRAAGDPFYAGPRPSPGAEDLIDDPLPSTGHATFFGNTAGYFGHSGSYLRNPLVNRLRAANQPQNPPGTPGTPGRP